MPCPYPENLEVNALLSAHEFAGSAARTGSLAIKLHANREHLATTARLRTLSAQLLHAAAICENLTYLANGGFGTLPAARGTINITLMVPVFVISLARLHERRAAITSHLRALGVEYELIDAIDGQTIPQEQRVAMQPDGANFHPGVLGCYLSHMEAYRRIIARNIPVALILEDDARLVRSFARALRQEIKSTDFDYCFLDFQNANESGHIYYDSADAIEIYPGFSAHTTHDGPGSTHAYLITKDAAARRLAHELPIAKPVDIYSTLPYRPRFRALVAHRGAGVSQDSLSSFTSSRQHAGQLSFKTLRRWSGYYAMREVLNPSLWAARRQVSELKRQGVLRAGAKWRPLPDGRRILY